LYILYENKSNFRGKKKKKKTVIIYVQKHTHAYSFLFLCFEKLAELIFYYYELSFASLDPDEVFCNLFVRDDERTFE
jgi:hypothetical protein